jgi:Beta-propeller repeat
VTKLNPAGSALVYSTYLGGSGGQVWGLGIAVDRAGSAYVTGTMYSRDFLTTAGAFDRNYNGGGLNLGGDAFVTKLSLAAWRSLSAAPRWSSDEEAAPRRSSRVPAVVRSG